MASSSTSKGSLLPFDILESILYRVPPKSLNRFKLVCKRWLNLLKDKRFIYNYLDLVQEHFVHLSDKVQIINRGTNDSFFLPFSDELRPNCINFLVIHCDGLLLCIPPYSSKLAVWNPFFNQLSWIRKPKKYSEYDTYCFGYDGRSRDNYKILRFEHKGFTDDYNVMNEIYEFKSNSWRTLDSPLDRVVGSYSRGSVSVKGNAYWILDSANMTDKCIQSFDFSTETFKRICLLPFQCNRDDETYDLIDLSVYKADKLSLLHQSLRRGKPCETEVWITNNVKDRVVSWIKLFAVSRPDLPKFYPSDRFKNIQYFIDKDSRINIMSYQDEILLIDGSVSVFIKLYIIGKDGFQTKVIGRHTLVAMWGYMFLPNFQTSASLNNYRLF